MVQIQKHPTPSQLIIDQIWTIEIRRSHLLPVSQTNFQNTKWYYQDNLIKPISELLPVLAICSEISTNRIWIFTTIVTLQIFAKVYNHNTFILYGCKIYTVVSLEAAKSKRTLWWLVRLAQSLKRCCEINTCTTTVREDILTHISIHVHVICLQRLDLKLDTSLWWLVFKALM